jgi:ethanolamine utilization protein EutQ (cupin superfamily)
MAKHILAPTKIESVGNKPKEILEFFGAVNSQSSELSIAKMNSPAGWEEPFQTPEFDEYTIILNGEMEIITPHKTYCVKKGEAFLAAKGEKVKYTTPKGAEYMAVCLPAFSPQKVHRDE